MIRMPLFAFIWQGEMKTCVLSSRRSSSMAAESSPPTVMQGRWQRTQRGSSSSSSADRRFAVHHRVEQRDDVAVHLYRVRHQHGVAIDPQDALRDAGLAVPGSAVKEQRLVPDQRRAQAGPASPSGSTRSLKACRRLSRLSRTSGTCDLDHRCVLLDRHRRRAHVLADLVAGGGLCPSGDGQAEGIVVADHALDFQQLLLPELVETASPAPGTRASGCRAGPSRLADPCSHKYRKIRSLTTARGIPRSSTRSGMMGREGVAAAFASVPLAAESIMTFIRTIQQRGPSEQYANGYGPAASCGEDPIWGWSVRAALRDCCPNPLPRRAAQLADAHGVPTPASRRAAQLGRGGSLPALQRVGGGRYFVKSKMNSQSP